MKSFLRSLALSLVVLLFVTACATSPTLPASKAPAYQSAYSILDRSIGSHNLETLSIAPQRKVVTINFDRPSNEIFTQLLTRVDLYDDQIEAVSFDHSASANRGGFGVGSVRICTFSDGKKLFEPLVVYEPNQFYGYTTDVERSTKKLPIKDVLLFYSFEDKSNGSSLVTVRAHYNVKIAILSPVVSVAFGRVLIKTFATAAETFGGRLVDPEA